MTYNTFYTLQPEWANASIKLSTTLISASENENIQSIYYFSSINDAPCQLIGIPDGCLDLIFNLNGDATDCHVIPSPTIRMPFTFRPHTDYVGVRLKPCHDITLFEIPLKELNTKPIFRLFDVAPRFFSLYERILQAPTATIQQHLLIHSPFLMPFRRTDSIGDTMKEALHLIQTTINITPQQLAQKLCYSERHIRNLFNEYTGFSPKHFTQIMKLQHVLRHMTASQFSTKSFIEETNFYDDAHFYKMFKKYVQMTPQQYVQMLHIH